jgi:hypothetical protein
MIKECVGLNETINFLNECLKCDREAITRLFHFRTFCFEEMAKHPTVQVVRMPDKSYRVGALGLINGLFGVDKDGWGAICMEIDDKTMMIKEFRKVEDSDKSGR